MPRSSEVLAQPLHEGIFRTLPCKSIKRTAFVIVLQPGVYTVRALGADGDKGVALVEIYEIP